MLGVMDSICLLVQIRLLARIWSRKHYYLLQLNLYSLSACTTSKLNSNVETSDYKRRYQQHVYLQHCR